MSLHNMKEWKAISFLIVVTAAASTAEENFENQTDDILTNFTHRQFYFGEDVPLPIFESEENLPTISNPPSSSPKRYYIMRVIKLNWYEAFAYCAAKNMRLMSPNTEELNDKIRKNLQKAQWESGEYWMSLNDLSEKNFYQWMATGMPLSYQEWLPGEPNHRHGHSSCDEERCVIMSYSKRVSNQRGWNDQLCSKKLYFICEK